MAKNSPGIIRFAFAAIAIAPMYFLGGCAAQIIATPAARASDLKSPVRYRFDSSYTSNDPDVLTTAVFESDQYQITEVSSHYLERMLQDLNRRKDYDYASHGNQPGPDAPYLWQWVQTVTAELQNRGYYFDADGQLHRPGNVVALR
jgi:hypothetical protein